MAGAVEPLTLTSLLTATAFDPVAAASCALALGAYLGGVRRLNHRSGRPASRSWPRARTAAFCSGVAVIAVATMSGLGAYDTIRFSVHVGQHVLLGIVAPVLLALGAPVTLALQASRRPTHVNLLRVLRSRPAAVIGHPVTALVVFGLTLFALYFSPLYELSLRNDVVHAWVHVHFVVAGCLFAWTTIGLDPVPHRLPHGGRLLLVLLAVPFHTFLGVALLSGVEPVAAGWYAGLGIGGAAALDDQRVGAAVMWLVGDLMALVLSVVVARQWWAAEQRRTRHLDARLDAERAGTGSGPGAAGSQSLGHTAETDVAQGSIS
jgi:cytochrome c oxidase assembly factor CtaG